MSEPTSEDQSTDPLVSFWQNMRRLGVVKVLIGLGIVINCVSIFPYLSYRHDQQDFAHYYVSSNLWLAGEQVYGVDLEPHYSKLGWEEFDEPVVRATNPPPLLALFAPLASLDPSVAHAAWMIVQLICFAVAVWFAWQCIRTNISSSAFDLMLAIFLFLPFLKVHFYYSQVQLLLLALVMYAYWLLLAGLGESPKLKHGGIVACIVISVAALIKIYPLVLLPWFVWRCGTQMRDRFVAAAVSAATLFVGCWITDFSLWHDFVNLALPEVSQWVKMAYDCFTLGNAAHQFGMAFFGPDDSGLYLRIGSTTGLLLLAAFYLWVVSFRSTTDQDRLNAELAILILLMLFCGGTCWWHYLVFLLFPMQAMASQTKDNLSVGKFALFAVAMLLFTNMDLPLANIQLLQPFLNQRPLIGMILMVAFLLVGLKSVGPSSPQNVRMEE